MPIGTLTAIGAGLGVAAGLGKGIGGALASRQMFTPEDERRLAELERQRERGQLGLSARERGALTAGSQAELAGQAASQQAAATQRAVAAGLTGGGVNMRQLFLGEQQQQEAQQAVKRQLAEEVTARDLAAAQAQRAEIAQLQAQRAEAKAGVRRAIGEGLAAAAGGVAPIIGQRFGAEIELAMAGKPSLRQLREQSGAKKNVYEKRVG